MIVINDKRLAEAVDAAVEAKKSELAKLCTAYAAVERYNKWVVPSEGIRGTRFDSTLLNKVYIGNVSAPRDVVQSLLEAFGPVSVTCMAAKECAFADFDNPHAAYLCIAEINGIVFEGRTLRAGRTASFPSEIPKELRRPDRTIVYVSNIGADAEEAQLEDIFERMGNVEGVRLVYGPSFVHKGYGYVKFAGAHDAREARGYSNKIELYGRRMRIGPTVVKMELPAQDCLGVPREVFEIKARVEDAIYGRGRMVVLRNLIGIDDADDDFDQEMGSEMRKYGDVVRFGVHKGREVAVYCLYSTEDEARHAFGILNGRFFGGRRIRAEMSCADFPGKLADGARPNPG